MSCFDVRLAVLASPDRARSLFTVRAAISSARPVLSPRCSALSLMCSYCRSRFGLDPRGMSATLHHWRSRTPWLTSLPRSPWSIPVPVKLDQVSIAWVRPLFGQVPRERVFQARQAELGPPEGADHFRRANAADEAEDPVPASRSFKSPRRGSAGAHGWLQELHHPREPGRARGRGRDRHAAQQPGQAVRLLVRQPADLAGGRDAGPREPDTQGSGRPRSPTASS